MCIKIFCVDKKVCYYNEVSTTKFPFQVGDEIVRINGLILSESTHEEVANILKLKKSLTLTVKCMLMIIRAVRRIGMPKDSCMAILTLGISCR